MSAREGLEAMRSHLGRVALIVGLIASSSGCSFIFVSTTPDHHETLDVVHCTSSRVTPVLDTLGGSYQVVRTGFALGASDRDYERANYPLSRKADIAIGLSLTTLLTASAIYGYVQTAQCDVAKDAAALRRVGRNAQPSPAALPPPTPACTYDAQCKGERICVEGRCVDPPPQLGPKPLAPSSPSPSPAAPIDAPPEAPGASEPEPALVPAAPQ